MILKRKTGELYILSVHPDLDGEILYPKVPQNFLTQNKHSDWKTQRILLYPSVNGALRALSPQKLGGTKMYVYKAADLRKDSLVEPDITMVPNVFLTLEVWSLRPVRVRYVAEIEIDKPIEPGFSYHHGPRSTVSKVSDWKWKEVLKPWEKKGKLRDDN